MAGIDVVRTVSDLRAKTEQWRKAGEEIAIVPTMGALHEGHIELVRQGKRRAPRTVVSIFVNPAQFAPTEDFDKYPRTFEEDCRQLTKIGADLVWAPTVKEMYPEGSATKIAPTGAAEDLESAARPHFFGGVTTVCCKLFNQARADYAMFGEKDYQQLAVIRQMVRDLNMPIEIVGVPTVREADGLAMSSRNRYLSPSERKAAIAIYEAITAVAREVEPGGDGARAIAQASARLRDAGFKSIDYIAVRDAVSLRPATDGPRRVLAAAWLGTTRLIDNVAVGHSNKR